MEDELIFDDDDFGFEDQPQDPEPPVQEQDDFTTEVLRLKGIDDPSKIKFEDESGAIVERSWNELSREEQLSILADTIEVEKDNLTEEEKQLIQMYKNSGKSLEELFNPIKEPVSYRIDELSDDEVYALDLLEKIGEDNITDEELSEAVNAAKQNETLFKKTVESLRKQYIQLQKDEEAQYAKQQADQQQAAYQQFATSIQTQISNLNSFAGQDLELSNEDIEQLNDFILRLDDQGVSPLGKALQNPETLTKAAFWILNEKAIVEELTKQMQESYKRGFEAGKGNTPKIAFTPKKKSEEENFDDDDW